MSKNLKIIITLCFSVGIILILFVIFGLFKDKTYTVTFDTKGGNYIPSVEVKSGEKVTKPTDPIKEGFYFDYWEYEGNEYDFTSKVEKNMTLEANWKELEHEVYTLTFTVDGKTETLEVSSVSEIDLEELTFEEKNGYELKWYVNGNEYDFNTPLTSDVTIEGKYVKTTTFTIKFNSDGGTKVSNQTVKSGDKAIEPTNVTKEGYILTGWYLNNKKYDFNTEVTKNITLVAKWEEDPNVKRYEVKFDTAGGSKVSSQRIIENKTAITPKNPTKTGYAFEGWYLNDKEYDFKTKVTKNITLVAKWRELEKYTITFNTDDGSNVASQTVTEGNKVTKPTNPTKAGYTFKEWQLNGNKYDFNNVVTGDITLVAVYERDKEQYTVTFNSDGGSAVANQIVTEGNKATKPTEPTREGYKFKEWQLNGNKYDFNNVVTGDITLKAVWEDSSVYTITATRADKFSPDSLLKVFKNGNQINVKEIKYSDGVHLCNGDKLVVTTSDIANEETFIVVLTDGSEVKATLD